MKILLEFVFFPGIIFISVPIAQLDRVPDYESGG